MVEKIIGKLKGAQLTYPFDEVTQVYKVAGKMFLLTNAENSYISLKNTPDKNDFLRNTFSEIEAGYHLNKEHWITIKSPENLPDGLLEELVGESYKLVVSKLPKKNQIDL